MRIPEAGRRLVFLGAACVLVVGCVGAGRSSVQPEDAGVQAIASVKPRDSQFTSRPALLPHLPAVASRGGCEPRYTNGRTGTCINDKPCRGFGMLENGQAVCACFATRGGCKEGYRCDTRGAECVKEDEPEFNRTR